jgi:hypothetical protein
MKRKGRRHLPKVSGDLDAADTARLFQRFRWNQYSPAGTVERTGFLARQIARNGTSRGWAWGWSAMRLAAPLVVGGVLVLYLITRLVK